MTDPAPPLNEAALEALKDAPEGECDGLALSDTQARAILAHVLAALPAPPADALVEALRLIVERFDMWMWEAQKAWQEEALDGALYVGRAALAAYDAARQQGGRDNG